MKTFLAFLALLLLSTGCSRKQAEPVNAPQSDTVSPSQHFQQATDPEVATVEPAPELREAEDIYRETIRMLEKNGF